LASRATQPLALSRGGQYTDDVLPTVTASMVVCQQSQSVHHRHSRVVDLGLAGEFCPPAVGHADHGVSPGACRSCFRRSWRMACPPGTDKCPAASRSRCPQASAALGKVGCAASGATGAPKIETWATHPLPKNEFSRLWGTVERLVDHHEGAGRSSPSLKRAAGRLEQVGGPPGVAEHVEYCLGAY